MANPQCKGAREVSPISAKISDKSFSSRKAMPWCRIALSHPIIYSASEVSKSNYDYRALDTMMILQKNRRVVH
jgi:hypothetical protein